MGQKINPISLRLQKTNRRYDSSWYSNYHYGELFLFDLKVRDYLKRILKQLQYPEGRALISHFSKGSKINLFAFNPTSSRQQKLGAFGLKGGVHKQERQRKLSPVLAKSFEHRNEETFSIKKRPLKALSSKSKALSIDQEVLLVNHVPSITCSEKKITASIPSDWQHNGSHLVPFFALKDTWNPSYLLKVKRLRDSCKASASLTFNIRAKQVQSNEELKVKLKQKTLMQAFPSSNASKSEHKQVQSNAKSEGTASTQLVQAENTKSNTLSTPVSETRNKQQVFSKTLSLWYQRAQGSTHPILVYLGAYKKTIPLRDKTKETSCKAVAFATHNPCSEKKITASVPCNKLLVPRDPSCLQARSTGFKQEQQSFSKENSLYRCHVEGVLDQQTGSSVKLVPFQVSTEKQSALFLAQEVVYFLEKRVSFRKIKDQILKELKNSKIIKGVRITCSGRVGGKSKKAQKAKTETVKQGQTSLGVFSSKIDFAQKSALTSFGLIGVKVWICFY